MPYPERARIELAILQELKAVGEEEPELLLTRLLRYFPQLAEEDLRARTRRGRSRWRLVVQRAKQALVRRGEVAVVGRRWRITEAGRRRADAEDLPIQLVLPVQGEPPPGWSHEELKGMLVDIGRWLGKHAEAEYQRYDVVWKEAPNAPRISHVFEVQVRGRVESALAKLKHAYDTQRSRPFLVVVEARDARRVREMLAPYLTGSFHEIGGVTTVLSPEEVHRLWRALRSVQDLLGPLTAP